MHRRPLLQINHPTSSQGDVRLAVSSSHLTGKSAYDFPLSAPDDKENLKNTNQRQQQRAAALALVPETKTNKFNPLNLPPTGVDSSNAFKPSTSTRSYSYGIGTNEYAEYDRSVLTSSREGRRGDGDPDGDNDGDEDDDISSFPPSQSRYQQPLSDGNGRLKGGRKGGALLDIPKTSALAHQRPSSSPLSVSLSSIHSGDATSSRALSSKPSSSNRASQYGSQYERPMQEPSSAQLTSTSSPSLSSSSSSSSSAHSSSSQVPPIGKDGSKLVPISALHPLHREAFSKYPYFKYVVYSPSFSIHSCAFVTKCHVFHHHQP